MIDESTVPNEPVSEPKQSRPKKFLISTKAKVIAAFCAVLLILVILVVQTYSRPIDDGFVRFMANIFPLPAISINRTSISLKEYLAEYDALKQYFDTLENAPNQSDIETSISQTLINKIAIRQLALERGVKIDMARVEQYYQDVLSSQDSEEAFATELKDTFGWTTEEFKRRIVVSIVLALQVSEDILADDEIQSQRVQTIRDAYDRIVAGEDFALVAKDVHAGFDASMESDLGYIKLSKMPDTWRAQVGALEVGSFTDVIELPQGHAIFKVDDRVSSGEGEQVHLFVITVPKKTLEEVVSEYIEKAKVKQYIGE